MRIEILENGEVVQTILGDEEFAQANYPDAWRVAEQQDPPIAPIEPTRRISVGAFYDRFSPYKWGVLSSDDAMVRAVIADASVRDFIDLENPDLPAGLAIIQAAGFDIDPDAILHADIQPHELP